MNSSTVALVVGSGGSEEEVKLGEALGLAYLEAHLREAFPAMNVLLLNAIIDAELREIRGEGGDDAYAAALRVALLDPLVCGVSLVYRPQRDWTARFVRYLRELGCNAHIIVGGMYPTSAWERILTDMPEVDSVCTGEGDALIVQLVHSLSRGDDFRQLPGLAWRDETNTPRASGATIVTLGLRKPQMGRLSMDELSTLVHPSRSQLPQVLELGGIIQVEASRGCDAGCVFCEVRHTRWRPRPIEDLADELEELMAGYPGTLVYMIDNIFLGFGKAREHLQRGQALARLLIERKITVRFVIQDRAANIDRATFELLKRAGLCEVYVGIESFSATQLRRLQKGADTSPEVNLRALETLGELGIYTQFGFLAFDEGITFEELTESVAGLRQAITGNPWLHLSNFNELIPYEGTFLERKYRRERGELPPGGDPWEYLDNRIWRVRAWAWRYSAALWGLTGLIFNKVQDENYQQDLWRTLPAKNAGFVGYLEGLLAMVDRQASEAEIQEFYFATVRRVQAAIRATLGDWRDGEARCEIEQALAQIDAQAALAYDPDPGPAE
jgi:radical SAM superfamily enzyme YgiQ (UPF0313 family)